MNASEYRKIQADLASFGELLNHTIESLRAENVVLLRQNVDLQNQLKQNDGEAFKSMRITIADLNRQVQDLVTKNRNQKLAITQLQQKLQRQSVPPAIIVSLDGVQICTN